MKKVALVFVLAVLLPSLVLAWLALRSLRDQQFLLERQQSLLDQRVTDTVSQAISSYLEQRQQEFAATVETLMVSGDPRALAVQFDDQLCRHWPLAEVGFCVTTSGKILAPPPNARPDAQMFRLDNSGFLGNREPVEVYWNINNANNLVAGNPVYARGGLNHYQPSAADSVSGTGRGIEASTAARAGVTGELADTFQAKMAAPSAEPPPVQTAGTLQPQDTTLVARSFGGETRRAGGGGENGPPNVVNTSPVQTEAAINGFLIANSNASLPQQKSEVEATRQMDAVSASAPPAPEPGALPNSAMSSDAASPAQSSTVTGNGFRHFGAPVDGSEHESDHTAAPAIPRQPVQTELAATVAPATSTVVESRQATEFAFAKGLKAPAGGAVPMAQTFAIDQDDVQKDAETGSPMSNVITYKAAQNRAVSPQSRFYQVADGGKVVVTGEPQNNVSKVVPAEAEFSQLIGGGTDGMLARFLQDKLKLMFWHRLSREPDLIFGAQLNLGRVVDGLRGLVQPEREMQNEICLAVLDDTARPVVLSRDHFAANWKRPFVATEIGDALPHWEVAAYLVNPAQLTRAANTTRLALGLLVSLLVLAIGIGSWLIVRSLNSELTLARQKTDFVSNVSHELKTPLTSIRMFSELLADGRVADTGKQHSYLHIISAEAARLTRLINNVLDFSRMERGEKKYNFQPCDLAEIVRSAAETFRPHLEANGFRFGVEMPSTAISIRGDADALSQVIVNLLSNAEKYSNGGKEVSLQLEQKQSPLPYVEVRVLDRGTGVPGGSEEKIFEKFYRAHDSLGSGIQGSGLGLTIARQIARAHRGDVIYEPREGGGSCFLLRLPIQPAETMNEHQ